MGAEAGGAITSRRVDVHAAAKVGALLISIASLLGFFLSILTPSRTLEHRTVLIVWTATLPVLIPALLRLFWSRLSWNLIYLVSVVYVLGITVAFGIAGPKIQYGGFFYVATAIFGFYFFSFHRAVSIVAIIAVAHAIQVGVQRGNETPVARWLYVMGLVVMSVAFVNSLIRAAERATQGERAAREAESKARLALAELNEKLEAKVADQVGEMERLGRLRRFLSPNLAEAVVGAENESLLEPHRREIAVFFIDLRGFTKFASSTEPEDVLEVLGAYYQTLGKAFVRFEATVGAFQGDGVMAYFNDPFPCPDPAVRAAEMADAVAFSLEELSASWRAKGHELGYGIGIAFGYATLGMIGFEGRQDYGPLGTVVNLASRLCDVAEPGQILVDRRTSTAVAPRFESRFVRTMEIKGFRDHVDVLEIARHQKRVSNEGEALRRSLSRFSKRATRLLGSCARRDSTPDLLIPGQEVDPSFDRVRRDPVHEPSRSVVPRHR